MTEVITTLQALSSSDAEAHSREAGGRGAASREGS